MKLPVAAALVLVLVGGGLTARHTLEVAGPATPRLRVTGTATLPDPPPDAGDWRDLLARGDDYVALGDAEGKARQSYLAAFGRARKQGSIDGMIRVAEAFATLEDWQMVGKVLKIADVVAGGDAEARADVRAAAARLLVAVVPAEDGLNED